ncbi:uncharacterized protein THITE_2115229 [Thermothielavioides terrestris NRRL 8126]|uniref:Protein CSF1 n=1 Tax=Thermothielavioides terrestris (strain ATCC 38088 / NRRL 8126) TaxID=578455 RepID=G2R3J2_THETT|nr:uncharacterized protein THITE_2115229 [Thermothielavioides terrestris NRRL 8126]AEO66802.1 hypothetical protein THITE_2115229 [Thermothielavioides terrestris NRRL 8126]
MSSGGFFSGDGIVFHPPFLGILIACGVLSVFSLLYFNRVFASVVSWAIRTYTWHQYGVYIDIQALQVSLLAGRIFFTGFRYHGNNETILVQNGHITWAYWLRRVREVNIGLGKGVERDPDVDRSSLSTKLPCRVKVSLRGLEWFIYNRSPAYDSVLSSLTDAGVGQPEPDPPRGEPETTTVPDDPPPAHLRRRRSGRQEASKTPLAAGFSAETEKTGIARDVGTANVGDLTRAPSTGSSASDRVRHQTSSVPVEGGEDLPLFLQLLPIHLECDRAALVMGNENTKAILVVKANSLSGEIDASSTKTPDPYRQYFRFKFKHPVIEMKENLDFKEEQADRAVRDKLAAQGSLSRPNRSFLHWQRRRLREGLRSMVPFLNRSVESFSPSSRGIGTAASQVPGSGHWQGLSRYLAEGAEDQKSQWAACEYAAVPTLLDSPEASLTILWDVVGKVAPPSASPQEKDPEYATNINGAHPPAWAINLSINGGSINYGPWADRHRADLQRTFAPSLCKDAVPARHLPPGAFRVPTQFKFFVELTDDTTIRIPVREASKDWRWQGKGPAPKKPNSHGTRRARRSKKSDQPADLHQRPYGWLDLRLPANATASYSMDMVAGPSGYTNTLDLDLPSTEISSSINHELLLRSGRQTISCDLSTPLGWNSLRQWRFNIASDGLELYILRDHVFLLTDLVDDWTSGPATEYLVFVPFKYSLDLQLQNVRLFLNLNDANIVSNPTDLDDNTYLIISSPLLRSGVCIPVDQYKPSRNAIPFDIRADTAAIDLHLPPWNTQASFLASKEVGRLENLAVEASYHYNATTSPANTDTLVLNISGLSPTARLHGFTIRYFLKVKDNYFGDDIHFKTLEEYQDVLRLKEHNSDAEAAVKPPPKRSNDLDVILNIRADDPKVLLPANLYSSQRHIQIDTASLCLDLRFTNYYMDMDLLVAPLNLSLGDTESGSETPMSATSSTQVFVDGLSVYGHRVFGLPPAEPTYMCNWDLSLGALTGECTTEFLTTLTSAAKAFAFTFDDDENALIPFSSIVLYDVTFLRVFVHSVRLWLHVEDAAFLLSTGAVDVNYNDWARSHYSRKANINIPDIKLSCLNAELATRHKARSEHAVEADALVETSVKVAIVGRKANFSRERKLQQELVRRHDQRTHRTPFLILPGVLEDDLVPDAVDPPAQSVPPVPMPVRSIATWSDRTSLSSNRSSERSRSLRHKSSFLSLSGSAPSSVRKPFSSRRSSGKGRLPERLNRRSPLGTRPDEDGHSPMQTRELSPSTRHSAFYSVPGDHGEHRDVVHNTVAFSSQFFAPYFPLENVKPTHAEAMMRSIENDEEGPGDSDSVAFDLGDVDPSLLSEDHAYSSILIELPSGLAAFCNPTSLRCVAALLASMQDTDPDRILDSLQMDSMKGVFGRQKDQKMKGRISDLLIRLPHANLRFIGSSEADSLNQPADQQDQYDLALTKLSFTSRSQATWRDASKPQSREVSRSFHVRLGSMELSAAERSPGMPSSPAAALVRIDSVLASMGTKDVTYFDVEIGGIRGNTFSGKVDYLASLAQRAEVLGSDIGRLFSASSSNEKMMARSLVHRLLSAGQSVPDPSFLIRPSAVLRSAHQHLRTFDSWKLAMRLRQIWTVLAPSAGEQIKFDCLHSSSASDAELKKEIIAAFERWRSWDLEDVEESLLISVLFGQTGSSSEAKPPDKPTLAVARIKHLQFAVNPGPKQNEITFVDLGARLQRKPVPAKAGDDLTGPTGISTILSVSCEDAIVSLNWELCELANSILKLIKRMPSQAPEQAPVQPDKPRVSTAAEPRAESTVHCVVFLGHGSLIVETVNLFSASFSNGGQASVLVRQDPSGNMDASLVLSCDSVTSSLRSHQQKLAKLILEKPSVFVSHELRASQTTDSHTVKTAASNQYMSLAIRQDPITLAEVFDLVVRDEFAQLYRLKKQLPSSPRPAPGSKKIADRLSAFRVNVALFMDKYTISLPLLRSLTYTIQGTVSRAAMAANFGREIIFDFDIKENSHDMQVRVNNVARSISLLQIPPTNGRIRSHTESGDHSISVFASVELVQLDASAVYSLLSALNRPEISSVLNELQQQARTIQEHISEVTGDTPQTTVTAASEKKQAALAYTAQLSFAGLKVFGNSPLKSETEPLAHISFALGSVHLGLSNKVEQHGPVLPYPEINARLRRVAFEMRKGSAEAMKSCGNVAFGALISASSSPSEDGKEKRFFHVRSDAFEVNLSPDTISTVIDVLGYMGDKIKDLDTSRELEYLRKLRQSKPRIAINDAEPEDQGADFIDAFLSSITYSFEICNIRLAWLVNRIGEEPAVGKEDLVFYLQRIELGTRTRNSARLTIEDLELQMVGPSHGKMLRSPNSALLPEIIFNVAYVSTADARRLAFQAVGKPLDVRLTSGFIIPAAHLNDSITLSLKIIQQASQNWNPRTSRPAPATTKPPDEAPRKSILGGKRLESLLIDADFAGAVVHLTGKKAPEDLVSATRSARSSSGKQGQLGPDETTSSTTLRSPGLAWKLEFRDNGKDDPSLHAEVKIDASSNVLYPSVVPLVVDISNSVKKAVSSHGDKKDQAHAHAREVAAKVKLPEEDRILTADPTSVLGRMKLNLGLRICKQEFSFSCQPIARVAATASFDDVYFTANTVRSVEQGNFFAISGSFTNLQASVQHVYSRESTGSLKIPSIVLSFLNSKHLSGTSGVSAILKFSPMEVSINAKQFQDFLLFREIWLPGKASDPSASPVAKLVTETSQGHLVQRYQQVAATAAFPWTASISIPALKIVVDLGQALGRSTLSINDFWISSKKTSDWEQNLCLGFRMIGVESTGRMSGFVALENFKLRTSIEWPEREQALNETPLVQASVGFSQFRVKAAFDYQAFLVADITSLEFLMYNVRRSKDGRGDRLIAIFDGEAVQVFGTTTSAAQGVALYQAFQKLVQERKANFETSLKEIEKYIRRKSVAAPAGVMQRLSLPASTSGDDRPLKSPISLDTDVVVTLKALNLGVFPGAFSDHQVFKMEALNAQARFAASVQADGRVHSILGLTLGQLRIGLAGVRTAVSDPPNKTLGELSVEDVVQRATGSRGGTILKVPQVEAVMQTWQRPESKRIDYIFKSAFEGKVEVGWNYSRISYIRGMWANHSKTLAQTWGRELPNVAAIRVTGVLPETGGGATAPDEKRESQQQQQPPAPKNGEQTAAATTTATTTNKITAEVKVPLSKYEYVALEPPVIETPQLRDMGEATPPLEWIGLNRDRLPNLTHQIVIVALLELAGEVEDAYSRILGST